MRYKPVLIAAALCLIAGILSGLGQEDSLREWYPYLNKSPLSPPDWVFAPVWTVLYIMIGASIGLIWMRKPAGYERVTAIFVAQFILNLFWSVIFFVYRSPTAALVIISLLLVLIIIYALQARRLNRTSALLFIPYILWVAFAWHLNLAIVLLN